MPIKIIINIVLFLLILPVSSNASGKSLRVDVIGDYHDDVTSMCSANCDSFQIVNYEVTMPLAAENLGKILMARGKLVEVKAVSPTAGPVFGGSEGEGYLATQLQVEDYKEFPFLKVSMKKKSWRNTGMRKTRTSF